MNQLVLEHPDASSLAAFVSGRLNEAESMEIEAHLADCAVCCAVLENLPQDSLGGLMQSTRTIADGNGTPLDAACPPGTGGPDLEADRSVAVFQPPPELADHPRYRIVDLLGIGGMGAVYKAEHRRMERMVALKVISPKLIASPAAVERFRREVKLAARLAHPNIVTAHDSDQAGSVHFLVMEFVDGKSLAQVVAESGPLPAAQACDYARQAALGLQHACDRHMVHRDIKPHNLMLTSEGQVKILDFGLARFVLESAPPAADDSVAPESTAAAESVNEGVTGDGQIMGSIDYMAPEQGRDAHQADIRSDIYSLGCTLYYLLAGHSPFGGSSVAEKLAAHGEQTAKPLTALRNDLPAGLAPVIERMMAKDPAQRYQTPAEVAEALAPFASARPQVRPRRRLRLALAASLLIIALGAVGYLYAPAIYRFATNQGELVIEVDDKDVEVVVKEHGNIIRIVDTKTTKALTLKAGKYEIDLTPEQKKKGLTLETDRITLTRGGRQIVKAFFNPKKLARPESDEIRDFALEAGPVYDVAYSPKGKIVAAGCHDGSIRLWDADSGQPIRKLGGHTDLVTGLVFSRDGEHILSASYDGTMRLWDVGTGKQLQCLENGAQLHSVAISADGKLGLSAGAIFNRPRWTMQLWDISKGERIPRPGDESSTNVHSVAISPDGRWAISGGQDSILRVWDVASGKKLQQLTGHSGWIAVSISRDGRRAASWSTDQTIRLWNWKDGKLVGGPRLVGHKSGAVERAIFSPDGHRVISSDSKTMRLWDAETGKELHRFLGPTQLIRGLAFSPDGKYVLSGSRGDGSVRLWKVPEPGNYRAPDETAGNGPGAATFVTPWSDSNNWAVKGKEIHQLDDSLNGHWILFGDPAWTDYDFEAEAEIIGGGNEVGLVFRAANPNNFLYAVIGAFGNSRHGVIAHHERGASALDLVEGKTQKRRWYRLRVEVRGNKIKFFIDGKRVLSSYSEEYPRGCVGLVTGCASARFRNIKVTDPHGKVLFEGVQGILPKGGARALGEKG